MPRCPKCHRDFEAAGFCPHDGAQLREVSSVETLQRLQPDLSSEAGATPAHSDPVPLRAVSAAEGTQSAVDLLREAKEQAKDKPYERLIGKTLDGRYRIKSVLGEGGMGVVFLAEHVVIEKAVAIKILKKETSRDPSVSKRFVREARAASRIGHPNIIDVTDFGTTQNGITYSVMEYVEGSTLSAVIKRAAPFDTPRIIHITVQMARALAAAHAKGVVHRDLKPDNVFLVDRDGRPDFVKIVDFGIARVLPIPGNSQVSRLTRVGSVFGTPEYMAPEQASGRSDTDHRVDVYALGTIMYEMFTGQVPHKAKSTVRTLAMQMLDTIPPMRSKYPELDIPEALEGIVMTALAKDRDERYADMTALLAALEALDDLDIGPAPARPGSTPGSQPGSQPGSTSGSTLVGAGGQPRADTGSDAVVTEAYAGRPQTGSGVHAAAHAIPTPGAMPAPDTGAGATSTKAPTELFDPPPPPPGEPAFIARKRTPDIRTIETDGPEPDSGSTLVWLGAFIVAAATVVVIILLVRGADRGEPANAAVSGDAAPGEVAAGARSDSGAASAEPGDAGAPVARPDAAPGEITAGRRPGTGRRPDITPPVASDAGPAIGSGAPLSVEVITRPKGGALYIGKDYAGVDGTNIERPHGSVVTVRCSKPDHISGKVTVRFDGDTGTAICRMRPKPEKKCVEGIKNPFENCP